MLEYHLFKKSVKSGFKTKSRWYYWYYDDMGRQIQKVCKNCTNKWEAEQFILKLPSLRNQSLYIKDIAKDMYIPGSIHVKRREQMGLKNTEATLAESRRYLERVVKQFGDMKLEDLTAKDVMTYLWELKYKSSWKNSFLKVIKELYVQASWEGVNIQQPNFPRFKNDYDQADPLLVDEVFKLMQRKNFRSESDFMFFFLTVFAGLRVSETRAFQPRQLLPKKSQVIVDGFMDKKNYTRYEHNKSGDEKNPKWRATIVPKFAIEVLEDYLKRHPKYPNDFMFTYNDRPYRIEFVDDLFQEALDKAHIERKGRKLVVHSLRYTYVTIMRQILEGEVVQKMVGHSSIKMTDYYTRMDIDTVGDSLLQYVDTVNEFMQKGKR